MNRKQLKEILESHNLWLKEEQRGERADLRGVNFAGTCLIGVNLRGANLEKANLEKANLEKANLIGANLEGVNLRWANLRWANLIGANLEGVNLRGANLEGVNLREANLGGANLDFTNWLSMACSSFNIKIDNQNFFQLCYHLCRLDCEDAEVKKIQEYLKPYANKADVIKRHNLPLI